MHTRSTIVGFIMSFAAGMFLMWGIDRRPGGSASATAESATPETGEVAPGSAVKTVNEGAVPVELYVMSQCPYGVQAEDAFKDVVAKFGSDIDFKVEYIGDKGPDGKPTSMHGAPEVKGNLVQICAMKYSAKWFDMVLCQNKNWRQVDTNWEACAKEQGMPVAEIGECATGKEGEDLLLASYDRATKLGISGSPTIRIGHVEYQGSRRTGDLMRAICNAATGEKPAACGDIPEAPKVNVTILTDTRCEECDSKALEAQLKSRIAAPVITVLDYAEPAGKKLYGEVKPVKLPALIFDKSLDADKETLAMVERGLKDKNDHRVLELGEWNPACNDTDGCALDECKDTMICRQEIPKRLDLFIMSQCPFGVKATDAMREVLDNFKKHDEKIDFAIHYIGSGTAAEGFNSMHGQSEIDEDIRHVCAIEHYAKDFKFMDYIWCRNKDWKSSDWEPCTGAATGIDKAVMKKCFEGDEGKKLLEKSLAITNKAGFGSSPTWLANNKHQFSGIDPETIKANLCKHNKLAGCDTKLTGQEAPAGAAQPGCGE